MSLHKPTLEYVLKQLTMLLSQAEQDRDDFASMAGGATSPGEETTLMRKSKRAGWNRSGLDLATDMVMDLIRGASPESTNNANTQGD